MVALAAAMLAGVAWAKRDGNWCAIDRHGHTVSSILCVGFDPGRSSGGSFECKVEPCATAHRVAASSALTVRHFHFAFCSDPQ
jgi:hypothetical protein